MTDQKQPSRMQLVTELVESVSAYIAQNVTPVIDDVATRAPDGQPLKMWASRAAIHLTIVQQSLELLAGDARVMAQLTAPPIPAPKPAPKVKALPPGAARTTKVTLPFPGASMMGVAPRKGLRPTLDEIREDDGETTFPEEPEVDDSNGGDDDFPEEGPMDGAPSPGEESNLSMLMDLMKRQVAQRAVIASTTQRLAAENARLDSMRRNDPKCGSVKKAIAALTEELKAAQEEMARLDSEAELLVQ